MTDDLPEVHVTVVTSLSFEIPWPELEAKFGPFDPDNWPDADAVMALFKATYPSDARFVDEWRRGGALERTTSIDVSTVNKAHTQDEALFPDLAPHVRRETSKDWEW